MTDKNLGSEYSSYMPPWAHEADFAVTICDVDGLILAMNEKAQKTFTKYGGPALVGKSLAGCHPPHAQEKIKSLMEARATNAYTIEKDGVKKLVYQTPWYQDGQFGGLIELSLPLPGDLPHYKRN